MKPWNIWTACLRYLSKLVSWVGIQAPALESAWLQRSVFFNSALKCVQMALLRKKNLVNADQKQKVEGQISKWKLDAMNENICTYTNARLTSIYS